MKLHKRTTEGDTGGDLGFVIARPNVSLESQYSTHTNLIISKDYRRGLLTQAKLKNDKGKWGEFSPNQENILPLYQKFLALLLYSYQDSFRYNLEPFKWQLCADYSFSDVKSWLKLDNFPNLQDSCKIIKELGNAKIGTDEKQIIDKIICPPENQSLIINIRWPDDKPPFSKIWIRTKQEEKDLAMPSTY